MRVLYNMTAWTEHIKEFAKTHGVSYGVAMKMPECKSAYKKDPCWSGYKQVGMKEKDDKEVPNCVPDAPKKRGRPKKVVAPAEGGENIQMVIAEKKPRGRPKKVVAPAEEKVEGDGLVKPAILKKLVAKLRADIKHHKGEGRPVDYLQACIKMLQGHMRGGADIQQKGLSAQIRTYLPAGNEDLYKELSFIVHSGDRNPHSHGHNPYADPTNTYDAPAESAILYAEQLVKGKTHLKKSIAVPRKRGATPPPPSSAKKGRTDSPLRVSPEMGAKHASASAKALAPTAEPFVPKEFAKGKGIATMPSGSRIYPLTLGQVARLARGIV
jgi:hypothetical protein